MRKSVYTLMLAAWVMSVAAPVFGQVCPRILLCPSGLQTICDPTENDSTLWNESPYTWSPLLQSADLYEGIADLNLLAVACPGGGPITVSYKIFLDLDSDLLSETVVNSNNLPPPGIVFANNGLNPDDSGGDTLWFDKRAIPFASKFQFTLESYVSNDTLRAHVRWNSQDNPGQFLIPRFPEGQHGILWTVTQDGISRTCQYGFKIKDCAPPTLICVNNLMDDIGLDRIFPVTTAQLIDFVADNISDDEHIVISMRKAGTGTGFPTANGNPVTQFTLNCATLGTNTLEVWAKDQIGNTSNCTVTVTLSDIDFVCTDLPMVCARTYWDTSLVIEGVTSEISWMDMQETLFTYHLPELANGCNSLDSFPAYPFYISPSKTGDPLNGVTTFDLLEISKHILAIQPLNNPWKIIAADANFSGSVTTNDVVQLRRLILGQINELPGNTSWRFFTDNCNFPPNPFEVTNCGTGYGFDPMPFWAYPSEIRFYGLKTGDVNNSALANSAQSEAQDRAVTRMMIPDVSLQAGETADIPIRLERAGNWQGFQCSLPFDASVLEILDIQAGASLHQQEFAFAQPKAGIVRVSWFDVAPQVLLPDENLFHLRVKALAPIRLQEVLRPTAGVPESSAFPSEIYGGDSTIQSLQFAFEHANPALKEIQVFPPQPNPFHTDVHIPVRLKKEETVRVSIGDISGKILYTKYLELPEGSHILDIPAEIFTENGFYTWRVGIGGEVAQGKLVRW